tara:strand:- start:3615 stop:3746 length:132 start_codon:yes stop_codon:yes gene_type:complete
LAFPKLNESVLIILDIILRNSLSALEGVIEAIILAPEIIIVIA